MAGALCPDGHLRVADLARTLSSRPQYRAGRLRGSAAAQCCVGAAVLRREEYRRRSVRNRCAVARRRVDHPGVRRREARRRVDVAAIPGLGRRRRRTESRDLETKSMIRFNSPHHVRPRTHLLSNGNYSVMLSAAGSGYSRWRDIAVTRWREDPTCDPYGYYVFLRDVFNGHVWSAGYQPIGREPENYDVAFFEDRVEISRKDGPIRTLMQILVSSEDDAEVRHLSLTNDGRGVRE